MSVFEVHGRRAELIQGDCVEVMNGMAPASFDLIIADPPYKLEMPERTGVDDLLAAKGIKLVNEDWDKFSLDGYIAFCDAWIAAASRLLKPHGSMFVFGSYHNIGLVNYVMQRQRLMIINDIAWFKRNAVPNLACRRLTASYETILWAATGKGYTFNYAAMKDYPTDIIHKTGKQMRNVWDIPTNGSESVAHPTQKPVALYQRIIACACAPGGVILDPFGGSGTLGVAASRSGFDSVMIERSPTYNGVITDRLDAEIRRAPPAHADEPIHWPGGSSTP